MQETWRLNQICQRLALSRRVGRIGRHTIGRDREGRLLGHLPARLHDHRFRNGSTKFLFHLVRNSFHALAFDLNDIGYLGLNDSGDPDPLGSHAQEAGARPHFP
jgi:hypothetical protein